MLLKPLKALWLRYNLSKQYLSFEEDFLVAVEWIDYENKDDNSNEFNIIRFSSTVFSGHFVSRDNVNLEWENKKLTMNVGVGIHLKVKEYSK